MPHRKQVRNKTNLSLYNLVSGWFWRFYLGSTNLTKYVDRFYQKYMCWKEVICFVNEGPLNSNKQKNDKKCSPDLIL